MDKELRQIVNELQRQGFTIRITTKGHVMVFLNGHLIATISGSPSDWRSRRNAMAAMKRAGFQWPPPRKPKR